jgi:C4-dicarboxylate-specific signal transduction histidine kinase
LGLAIVKELVQSMGGSVKAAVKNDMLDIYIELKLSAV